MAYPSSLPGYRNVGVRGVAEAVIEKLLKSVWSIQVFMQDCDAKGTALERFRRKGKIPRGENSELLSDFDRLVLTAIAGFDGEAHIGNIAQKIQQETGMFPEKHIWAQSYERNIHDVLGLQNEIASAIAAEIQGNCGGDFVLQPKN